MKPETNLKADGGSAAVAPSTPFELGIGVVNVRKSFDDFVALGDVSMSVAKGDFVTLLGASGSGKTTLLNIVAGFLRPDQGRIHFGGKDVTLDPVNRRDVGMVFQNYALFPHMSVAANVGFPLKIRRVPKAEIARRVDETLRMVRMESMADRNVAALSGGQRQRVALARAVVFGPKIVLMDEPLSALDKSLREHMQIEIRRLHERIGATTIYVTHDQREALSMSDQIAVMSQGRIMQFGTPRDVYERPVNAFVARFVGESVLLPVTRTEQGVRTPDGTELTARDVPLGDTLHLILRAERLTLATANEPLPDTMNEIRGVMRDVVYHGDSVLVLVECGLEEPVSIRRPASEAFSGRLPAEGSAVSLRLPVADTRIVTGNKEG
ncbi:MAG: ABC transporter ATP-binding protein [Pseudomonadota bacterium]|nr:ABC transporter ATP-binding protein [Pseudomonadota bacterium]